MNENELQPIPVPKTVPVPGKVPVPRGVPVSETVQDSQENSSDSRKFAIGIGILCFLLILLLLLLLLRNATMLPHEDTSAQQPTVGIETADNGADTAFDNQGQETNQNSTENNSNQQSAEAATSAEDQTSEQAQNKEKTEDSDTKMQEDGHKKSATEKQSEDKPQTESSENITQSEKTTDVSAATTDIPTQNQTLAPSFQPKHSENDADGYSDGFHQGDATVKIFGTTGKGSRFVFVFDRSYSMAGNPLEATKRELIQSLISLRDHHQFNIIFYDNQQLIWKPNDKLISAVKQNKKDAEQFITNIGPGGGTEPLQPLLTAIDYKPEVIIFLTDGELELDLDYICSKSKKIRINVIQFGSNGTPSALLQKLAKRTHGDYKYIDVKKFDAL